MKCSECGHENPPDNLYCGRCGRRLLTAGSAKIPDWLLPNPHERSVRTVRRGWLRRIETPYYTVSWSVTQARKWAMLSTIVDIPLAISLLIMAYVVDNLYLTIYVVALCVVLMSICAYAWVRVESMERAVYGESQEMEEV